MSGNEPLTDTRIQKSCNIEAYFIKIERADEVEKRIRYMNWLEQIRAET